MIQYEVAALCNVCGDLHPIDVLIALDNGPAVKKSVGESYPGTALPPQVAALKDSRIYCPKTGRHYAQKNDYQIFLTPVQPQRPSS